MAMSCKSFSLALMPVSVLRIIIIDWKIINTYNACIMNDVSLMKLLNVDFKIKRSGNDGKMKCLIIKDDQTL